MLNLLELKETAKLQKVKQYFKGTICIYYDVPEDFLINYTNY